MKNTMKAIAALIISATMISITACGNTDNTSSAPPKGNHNGFKAQKLRQLPQQKATLTSQCEETTFSATTTGTSASTKSTSSSKSSTKSKEHCKGEQL